MAFVYDPRSFAAMAVAGAAEGVCELVWVIDTSQPEVTSMARLLRRLGTVVDVADQSLDAAAASVAAARPAGILALSDAKLEWTAQVAGRLGLPFLEPDVAGRLSDKHAQREALRSAGLPTPRCEIVPTAAPDEVAALAADETMFPAVLKPQRGEASRDTRPVGSGAELVALVRELQEGSDPSARVFVLEQYIPDSPHPVGGQGFAGYVSVESAVRGGTVRHLAVTGRMPVAPPFRETGFFIPSAIDAATQGAVLAAASAAAAAIGVTSGCLHTEIKLTPGGPVVIEVNGRIGGGVPEMLASATGVQLLPLALGLALGDPVAAPELPPCHRVAYLFYVQAPASYSEITAVEGLDDLAAVPGVDEVVLNRGPGRAVDWREGNHGHVVSVSGAVSDHDGLRRMMALVPALVHIRGR